MTEASKLALENLRTTSHFQWYVVPIFVLTLYVYANEIERKNWRLILAGLAFWLMDWFNEVVNGVIFHLTGHSALWTAPADSAYIIFVGLNIEITMMFAILGIVCIKFMPEDKTEKVWGIPNRWFFAVFNSILCVIVEIFLNRADALIWEYWFWNIPMVLPIIVFGYGTFMVVSFWVYDLPNNRARVKAVLGIATVDILLIVLFGPVLGWI